MTHNPNVYGYVNGKPVFSRDEFIFEHRKRGPIEDDAELIAFAEKATSGWHNAGWSHSFISFYLSDYALSEPFASLTLPRADDGRRAEHPQGPRHQLRRRRPDQGQGHLHHRRRSRRPRRDQVGQAQERRGLDLSGLRHETLKPHRKAETRPEIPGGLFLFYRAPHCFNLAAAIL